MKCKILLGGHNALSFLLAFFALFDYWWLAHCLSQRAGLDFILHACMAMATANMGFVCERVPHRHLCVLSLEPLCFFIVCIVSPPYLV